MERTLAAALYRAEYRFVLERPVYESRLLTMTMKMKMTAPGSEPSRLRDENETQLNMIEHFLCRKYRATVNDVSLIDLCRAYLTRTRAYTELLTFSMAIHGTQRIV